MSPSEAQVYLDSIVLKTELSDHEKTQVTDLTKQPGFALLLGLLLGERQGCYAQFRNVKADDAQRVGVIQGTIIGIERPSHIILECVTAPAEHEGKN